MDDFDIVNQLRDLAEGVTPAADLVPGVRARSRRRNRRRQALLGACTAVTLAATGGTLALAAHHRPSASAAHAGAAPSAAPSGATAIKTPAAVADATIAVPVDGIRSVQCTVTAGAPTEIVAGDGGPVVVTSGEAGVVTAGQAVTPGAAGPGVAGELAHMKMVTTITAVPDDSHLVLDAPDLTTGAMGFTVTIDATTTFLAQNAQGARPTFTAGMQIGVEITETNGVAHVDTIDTTPAQPAPGTAPKPGADGTIGSASPDTALFKSMATISQVDPSGVTMHLTGGPLDGQTIVAALPTPGAVIAGCGAGGAPIGGIGDLTAGAEVGVVISQAAPGSFTIENVVPTAVGVAPPKG